MNSRRLICRQLIEDRITSYSKWQVPVSSLYDQRSQRGRILMTIQANPVKNFDLARVVNVFAAYIQFYELEVSCVML